MKRGKVLILLLISILLVSPLIIAADANATTQTSVEDKAYACLNKQIDDLTCTELSSTQKIFALMSTGKCLNEVRSDSKAGCWPSNDCSLKTTAQAVLALERVSESTDEAEAWLLSQNDTPSDVDWFLQIESNEETECTIKYSTGGSYDFRIRADKKLSGTGGSCLSLYTGSWWYRISPSCYTTEFEISCDKGFLTNLLFKEKTSSTIHISEQTSSTSAEGTTHEKVNSFCLKENGKCDYEGTLWAAVALSAIGDKEAVNSYMPFLITQSYKYPKILPEALLYLLTDYDEYRNTLLQKQKNGKYWDESGSKFFDTALALFPFQYSSSQEKSNAISWLTEVQEKTGCWDGGNVLTNSFILVSLWPKQIVAQTDTKDCLDSNFFCMSEASCDGKVLPSYSCTSGTFICCDTAKTFDVCRNQGGDICNSGQECIQGTIVDAGDTESGEVCCANNGRCENVQAQTECQTNSGSCRSFCGDTETESNYDCGSVSVCCTPKTSSGGISWWIWFLVILIILVILAIVFREKLRLYWEKLKSKFKKSGSSPMVQRRGPGFPPASSTIPFRGMPQRRVFSPTPPPTQIRRPAPKQNPELDEVLRKLKEIGK